MTEPSTGTRRVGRADRLRASKDFQRVMRTGSRGQAGPVRVQVVPATHRPRLGLAVSRRTGNAVHRNRLKRILRAAFASLRHGWPEPLDVVVIIARKHERTTANQYTAWLETAVRRAAGWSSDTP